MASRAFAVEDLSCPVCCDIFINPVLLSCSHSVCSTCIQKVWKSKTLKECPICRGRSSNDRPPLNLALRNLCESFLQESMRSSAEDEAVCSVHREKLKLFCLDDQQPVCLVCRDSRKHADHKFCPIDEAVMDNKDILNTSLEHLREALRKSVNHEQNLCKTAEDIKFHAQLTETQIKEDFEDLHQCLRNEEAARITALREEEEQRSQKIKQQTEETTKQISSLTSVIRDIEEQMKDEDVSFLQNFKAALQRAQYSLPHPDSSPSVTITFTDHLTNLKLKVLQKMQDNIGETSDFNIDQSPDIFDDSVKYNEDKHFQSSRGNSPHMLSIELLQVKENEMRTATNSWRARSANESQQVKENERRTATDSWRARSGNDSQQVKENERRTATDSWRAKSANDSQQVKENERRTATNPWRARSGNDSQQVKENERRTATNSWRARSGNDSQQVKENEKRTATNSWRARSGNDSQ